MSRQREMQGWPGTRFPEGDASLRNLQVTARKHATLWGWLSGVARPASPIRREEDRSEVLQENCRIVARLRLSAAVNVEHRLGKLLLKVRHRIFLQPTSGRLARRQSIVARAFETAQVVAA
jgi:hypothetical protein